MASGACGIEASSVAQARAGRRHLEIGLEVLLQQRLVGERHGFGGRLEKEIERVDHRHLGDQPDLDRKARGGLGDHEAGEVVAVRVLLPVEEVLFRLDLEAVAHDARAAVRCGAQADDLRAQLDRPVIGVGGAMLQRNVKSHGNPSPLADPGENMPRRASPVKA